MRALRDMYRGRHLHLRGWTLLTIVLERCEHRVAHVNHLVSDAADRERRAPRDESSRCGEVTVEAQVVRLSRNG